MATAATGSKADLGDMVISPERDRIADGLQDAVTQVVFSAGLMLQDAAEVTAEPEVRWRIEAAADDLDELVRLIRDTLFSPAIGRRTA